MPNFIQQVAFEIQKISPQKGDFVMIRMSEEKFDQFGSDELGKLAQALEAKFPGINVFFASDDCKMELINKTQLANLGLRKIEAA